MCVTARGESRSIAWPPLRSSPCHTGLPSPRPSRGCSPQSRNKKKPRSRAPAADLESSLRPPAQPRDPFCSILQLPLRAVSSQAARQEKEKKKSLQNPPTPPVSSRIRGINVEIVARRCSSTSEMKYLLLKVEKRCQTTIEKILKSIVDERRSPNLLAARIYARLCSPGLWHRIGN